MSAPEPDRLLHFKIIEVLGSGGNGTVYRARDQRDDRVVALKTLKNASEATLTRFKREFLALQKMDNPGIVSVYEGFFEHTPPFFSMEWVKGKTLSQVLRDMEQNPLVFDTADRENFAVRLAIQACGILAYIHDFDEVHRDLKPDNLFVTIESGDILADFTLKMLDFGLLKQLGDDESRVEEEDSQSGMIVGTVHYLSPEQAKGSAVDARADLYSLGVIMYKIISLALPYEAKDVVGYIFKTVFEEPIPIEQQTPDCSKRMQALLKDLLAKEPGKRPPTAQALERRLRAMLAPERGPELDIQAADLDPFGGIEGFGGPLLPPPLVGREPAVKALEKHFELLETQHPLAATLIGEDGMGRTAVLKEWKLRCQFEKPALFHASFTEEALPSQEPVGMLIDSLVRTLKPEEVRLLFRDVYPYLAHASRYLGRYFDVKSVGRFDHLSPSRKLQVMALNFIKLLQKLGERGPAAIVLNHVHHAPERFFGWLTLVWEQLGRTKTLLVFAMAPDSGNQAAERFLQRLRESPNALDLALGPLEPEQVRELVQAMLPIGVTLPFSERLTRCLMDQAGGNPFYTTELFSRLYEDDLIFVNQGSLDLKKLGSMDMPRSIQQALLKKANKLPEPALALLNATAVFGVSAEWAPLRLCLDWPEERMLEQVAVLLKQGLLLEEAEPIHRLSFQAPALQAALYRQIPAQRRRSLHERAARALETSMTEENALALEQIAYHFEHSGNRVRAVKYAYLAGSALLEAKETDKAVRFFQSSLALMERMENKQARNLVNLKLAEVHLANGRPKEALRCYNESLATKDRSKLEALRALRGRMLCFLQTDQLDLAYVDAQKLCALGPAGASRIHAEALRARGHLAWLSQGDAAAYASDLEEAVRLAPQRQDWRAELALTLILANRAAESRRLLKTLAKTTPNDPAVNLTRAALAYFTGDFETARADIERVRAEQAGRPDGEPRHMVAQALLTYKIMSTVAPDHSSDEYLGIAGRYVARFELDRMRPKIALVRLEHLLINGRCQEAWALTKDLADESIDLPVEFADRCLFLCLVIRAAWEMEERPPRGWLIQFQALDLPETAPCALFAHWAMAKAAEALLPYSTAAPQALELLEKAAAALVRNKYKYYYRATLVKQMALLRKLGREKALAKLEKLRLDIDPTLGVALPAP